MKGSNTVLYQSEDLISCFLDVFCCSSEQASEQTVDLYVIRCDMMVIWRQCNENGYSRFGSKWI